jgi:hypothetical protein
MLLQFSLGLMPHILNSDLLRRSTYLTKTICSLRSRYHGSWKRNPQKRMERKEIWINNPRNFSLSRNIFWVNGCKSEASEARISSERLYLTWVDSHRTVYLSILEIEFLFVYR